MSAAQQNKENLPPRPAGHKRPADDECPTFTRGPAKKQCRTDPLTLLKNGIARSLHLDLGRITEEELSAAELSEHQVYQQLLQLSPSLEERLVNGTDQELYYVADMLMKGSAAARSDDTRSLKSAVVDWIIPQGGYLSPSIARNVKDNRGFHHPRTGELLCPVQFEWSDEKIRRELVSGQIQPAGDLWARFLYRGYHYDAENPWEGLFRSGLLVKAYKHVFTSPSSVLDDGASRATRSSNSRLHGMKAATVASIAYIATQVRFALSSAPTFARIDAVTDSEQFYSSVIDLLEDPEECAEVGDLLKWWNEQIFPTFSAEGRELRKDSVHARIKEKRRQMQELTPASDKTSTMSPRGAGVEDGSSSIQSQ